MWDAPQTITTTAEAIQEITKRSNEYLVLLICNYYYLFWIPKKHTFTRNTFFDAESLTRQQYRLVCEVVLLRTQTECCNHVNGIFHLSLFARLFHFSIYCSTDFFSFILLISLWLVDCCFPWTQSVFSALLFVSFSWTTPAINIFLLVICSAKGELILNSLNICAIKEVKLNHFVLCFELLNRRERESMAANVRRFLLLPFFSWFCKLFAVFAIVSVISCTGVFRTELHLHFHLIKSDNNERKITEKGIEILTVELSVF